MQFVAEVEGRLDFLLFQVASSFPVFEFAYVGEVNYMERCSIKAIICSLNLFVVHSLIVSDQYFVQRKVIVNVTCGVNDFKGVNDLAAEGVNAHAIQVIRFGSAEVARETGAKSVGNVEVVEVGAAEVD